MTKSELVTVVAEKLKDLTVKDVETAVDTIFDIMSEALAQDQRIEIRGLGSFVSKVRQARQGRNPKTGAVVAVPKKRTPFFTVGKDLKDRVDEKRDKK